MLKKMARMLIQLWCDIKWSRGRKWVMENKAVMIEEAKVFLSEQGLIKSGETMDSLARKWSDYVKKIFKPSEPGAFYLAWTREVGAANIAANIMDQFARPYIPAGLFNNAKNSPHVLDFGCGTAVISLLWQRTQSPDCALFLADVDNLGREFTAYQKQKYPKLAIELLPIDLAGVPDESMDIILCVHVLEHIANPVAVLKMLDSKLKRNGKIFLEAPWGGHPEHIQEAIEDWKNGDGAGFLKKRYRLIEHLNPFTAYRNELSGIYEKK
jgi:2-polyprenyl-3-methyl-5-hydroxy-6-metoxy-1,4-benzoquinol methylase